MDNWRFYREGVKEERGEDNRDSYQVKEEVKHRKETAGGCREGKGDAPGGRGFKIVDSSGGAPVHRIDRVDRAGLERKEEAANLELV